MGGHSQTAGVLKNLRTFNALRYHRYDAKLGIAFVAMKSNVRQLARLPHFISVNKIDDVNISNVYPSDGEAEKEALYLRTVNMGNRLRPGGQAAGNHQPPLYGLGP